MNEEKKITPDLKARLLNEEGLSRVSGAGVPFDIKCLNCGVYNHFGNIDPDWKEVTCMKCGALITRR